MFYLTMFYVWAAYVNHAYRANLFTNDTSLIQTYLSVWLKCCEMLMVLKGLI